MVFIGDFAGFLDVGPLVLFADAFTGLFEVGPLLRLVTADFAGLFGLGTLSLIAPGFTGLFRADPAVFLTAAVAGFFKVGVFLDLLTAGLLILAFDLGAGAAFVILRVVPVALAVLRGLDDAAVLMTSFAMFVSYGRVSHELLDQPDSEQ